MKSCILYIDQVPHDMWLQLMDLPKSVQVSSRWFPERWIISLANGLSRACAPRKHRLGAMDLSDVQQQMSSGLNFGIMNAMRTGNPILDVMVCMLIPVVLSLFMGNANSDPMSSKIRDSARFLTLG